MDGTIIYTVYEHINKINNKKYIGITKQKPENRWGNNGANYKNDCPYFWNAICKYGWNNFIHNVLYSGLSKSQACSKEIELIKDGRTQNREFGYNIMSGGSAPSIPYEIRCKMSRSMMGNKNGLGHPCSEDKKKKISDAQKGREFTDEHRMKLSASARKRVSPPCSEEKREKISKSHKDKKPIYCYETNTVYESVHECARALNLYPTSIVKCCKGKLKTTGGYHVKYYS